MDRAEEIRLMEQCFSLHARNSTTLAESEARSPVSRYLDPARFEAEMSHIHRALPMPVVHGSELPGPHSFRRVATSLGDLVVTRDEAGRVHAFHNVCRHRGARLVNADDGCSRRLTCPYHAWSYATDGSLQGVPGQADCFPGLERSEAGLSSVPALEAYGFVWLCPQPPAGQAPADGLEQHLGRMGSDLGWMQMENLVVFKRESRQWQGNWKLFTEVGMETYHFRTAHRKTIAPYFLNNCSQQARVSQHFRVIMPTRAIEQTAKTSPERGSLRDLSHTVFVVVPQSTFLVQERHIDWVQIRPLALDRSEIIVTSLVPAEGGQIAESELSHWQKNFDITLTTLDEEFVLGESIHSGLASGANDALRFGRNEGLLDAFNLWVDEQLARGQR